MKKGRGPRAEEETAYPALGAWPLTFGFALSPGCDQQIDKYKGP